MRIAVPRYSRGGQREPGVVYIDATTFGLQAVEHAERLSRGSRIGLAGRLDADEPVGRVDEDDEPAWYGVVIDQLDFL
jgi:single-stranded DNA-binding protein